MFIRQTRLWQEALLKTNRGIFDNDKKVNTSERYNNPKLYIHLTTTPKCMKQDCEKRNTICTILIRVFKTSFSILDRTTC